MSKQMLFNKYNLRDILNNRRNTALANARGVTLNIITNNSVENITDSYADKFYLEPLKILKEGMILGHRNEIINEEKTDFGRRYSSPHHILVLTISIPYSGTSFLWDCLPDSYRMELAYGWIICNGDETTSGTLKFEISVEPQEGSDNKGVIEKRIADRIGLFNSYISTINNMVENFNSGLKESILRVINEQSNRLNLSKSIIESLDIPLSRNPNAPEFLKIPIKKAPSPVLNTKAVKPAKPEYDISNDNYEHILKIIQHEGRTHEQTSNTIIKLEEEEIRDLYLAHLNGHYQGIATGETFRKAGKTDIRLEFENRSAFVGECKIWHGEKELHDAIGQLAGYTTWRDCKCSLIIYNKTVKGFTSVVKEMSNRLNSYKDIIGKTETLEPGEWRIRIKSKDDENRHIIIHVFLFNLYNPE